LTVRTYFEAKAERKASPMATLIARVTIKARRILNISKIIAINLCAKENKQVVAVSKVD
jgi:hypothetical protein